MKRFFRVLVTLIIKLVTALTCQLDLGELEKVPVRGPLILAINHIGSLEVPLLVAYLHPRKVTGLAKVETWDSKLMGWLFDLWDCIPIRRGDVDLRAFQGCFRTLEEGKILAIAPEGTRSNDGILARGLPGIVSIALHSDTPILPLAHWGGEAFSNNIKNFRKTKFHIRVGEPFKLNVRNEKVDSQTREKMIDEIMCEMAKLMPESYRGHYRHCDQSPQKYLDFVLYGKQENTSLVKATI